MSMTVDNNGNISGVGLNVNGEQLDTEKSIQFIFAQLQNELAKANKDKALGIINEIKESQNQAKRITEIINYVREVKGTTDSDGHSYIKDPVQWRAKVQGPAQDITYKENGAATNVPYEKVDDSQKLNLGINSDLLQGFDQHSDKFDKRLDSLLEILKSKQEQCGTDIQQKMVFVQDWIGQYNAYQQGASTAISQANQTLSSLARGQ
ncbi:MAG: hypothetical protein IJ228_10710 [Succinivibrio sp.]|nr:hypothetical protein [Succinivibrio sp.]